MPQQPIRIHAQTHLRNGQDPLSHLGEATWAFLEPGTSLSVGPSSTKASVSGSSYQFYTSDSSVFSETTVISGSTYPAIGMELAGHYLVQTIVRPVSAIPDGVAYGATVFGTTDGDESTLYATPSARLVPTGENAALGADASLAQILQWTNYQSLGDGFVAPPAKFVPACRNYDATHTLTVALYAVAFYLDSGTVFLD